MKYLLTDPETHIDFGLGVLASDFYNTAEFLWNNNDGLTEGVLPNLFLYRHSIELVNHGDGSRDSSRAKHTEQRK